MTTIIPSTGQTLQDLLDIEQIVNSAPSGTTNTHFTPPALLNPHYVPPNIGLGLLITTSILFSLSVVSVFFRLLSRYVSNIGHLFWEDWVVIVALIITIGSSIINIVSVAKWEFGMHVYDLRLNSLVNIFRTAYAFETLHLWGSTAVRISIVLFVQRLYRSIHPRMYTTCTVFIICNLLYSIAVTFAYVFQCNNARAAYDIYTNVRSGCAHFGLYYFVAAIQILMDLLVLLIPIKLVWGLRIPMRKRLEVISMFALGLLACAAAIVRLVFFFHVMHDLLDYSWELISISYCCSIESNLAIITSCIPAIKAFFVNARTTDSLAYLARNRRRSKALKGDKITADISATRLDERDIEADPTSRSGHLYQSPIVEEKAPASLTSLPRQGDDNDLAKGYNLKPTNTELLFQSPSLRNRQGSIQDVGELSIPSAHLNSYIESHKLSISTMNSESGFGTAFGEFDSIHHLQQGGLRPYKPAHLKNI